MSLLESLVPKLINDSQVRTFPSLSSPVVFAESNLDLRFLHFLGSSLPFRNLLLPFPMLDYALRW